MRTISMLLVVTIAICSLAAPSLAWEPKPGGTRISGRVIYDSGDTLRFSDLVYAALGSDKDNNPVLTIQYKTTTRQIPIDKISYILIHCCPGKFI